MAGKKKHPDWIICGKGDTICNEIILTGKELAKAKRRYKVWKDK